MSTHNPPKPKTKHPGVSLRIDDDAWATVLETSTLLRIPASGAASNLIRIGAKRLEIFTAPASDKRQRKAKA